MQLQNSSIEPDPYANSNYRMFTKKSGKINLDKTYKKILYLYPAFNNTYVFLGVKGLRQDCVVHVDSNGQILFEYVFSVPIDTAGMLSDKEFILLQTRSKWYLGPENAEQHEAGILILNLETYKFQRTPHYFFNEETDQSYIVTFAQTKFLCIKQIGRYNDHRFKLSYYQYPLKPQSQPIHVFFATQGEWTYEYIIKQTNDHSMFSWFKARHDKAWDFRTYDLRENPNGNYRAYTIKQTLGIPYNIQNIQCALNTMWQIRKNQFMMVCNTNKTDQHKNKQLGIIQNNYILNVQTQKIRQSTINLGEYQELTIDQTSIGDICMFKTFDFKDSKPIETPIYYINKKTEEVVMKQSWFCSYLHKDEPKGARKSSFVHNQYENGDCDWFICEEINFKKMFRWKDASLSLMLGINKDFDDDLMANALDLMDFEDDILPVQFQAK